MAAGTTFERIEKKYLLTEEQYLALREKTMEKLTEDQYGLHTICNLYYDTEDSYLIRHSLEKPVYKEKLRLRSYGIPNADSEVFLELKKKYRGIVYKRRIHMSLVEAERFLNHGIRPQRALSGMDLQILQELEYAIQLYSLQPKEYIAYNRIACYGTEDASVRVTFDTRIRSREVDLHLEDGDAGRELLPQGMRLMEIKVPGAMPLWMAEALNELKIYPISFSKYGSIYQKLLQEKERQQELSGWCARRLEPSGQVAG